MAGKQGLDKVDSTGPAALLHYLETVEVGDNEPDRRINDQVDNANDDEGVRAMITMEMEHELELLATAEACRAEGSERAAKLSALLVEKERCEDILRMGSDAAFRERLYAEFGL